MARAKFRVPASSRGELEKLIKGYANQGENVSLDDLSRLLHVHKTQISKNNPFLVEVGLITKGRPKSTTPLGKRLGRALEHDRQDEIRACWQEAVKNSEPLSQIVSAVRVRKGMKKSDLESHVLFAADLKKTAENKAGARCVVELLITAGFLVEDKEKGKVLVATPIPETAAPPGEQPTPPAATAQAPGGAAPPPSPTVVQPVVPTVAINIQLQIPESENKGFFDSLFKSLRENLLGAGANGDD